MGVRLGDALIFVRGDRSKLGGDLDKAEKQTKGWAGRVGDSIRSGLGRATKVAIIGTTAAVASLGLGLFKLSMDAAQVEGVRNTFELLAESVGGDATTAMEQLREATRGMVSDADLMSAGNKFLAMGLADTTEGAAELAEVATQLGMAMGEDATGAMESFALTLANQSLPRLDSFGISSGRVRSRILELMEATEGLTREQAFTMAVMEEARVTMEKVGEQGDTTAARIARLKTQFKNVALQIGTAALPMLGAFLTLVERGASVIMPHIVKAMETFATVLDVLIRDFGAWTDFPWEDIFPSWLASIIYDILGPIESLLWYLPTLAQYFRAVAEDGDYLNDYLVDLPDKIRPVVSTFGRLMALVKTFVKDHAEGLKGAIKAIGIVLAKAALLSTLSKIAKLLTSLTNPVMWFIAIVGLLGMAWTENWWGIQEKAAAAIDFLRPYLEELVAWLQDFIPQAIQFLSDFVYGTLLPAFQVVSDFISGTVVPIVEMLVDRFVAWLIPALTQVSQWVQESLIPALQQFAEFLAGVVAVVVEEVGTFLLEMFGKVVTWFQDNWPLIQETAQTVLEFLQNLVQTILTAISDFWTAHGEKIIAFVTQAWETIKVVIETVLDVILGIIRAVMQAINGDWEGAWETIKGLLPGIWEAIQSIVGLAIEGLKGLISIALDGIEALWGIAWEAIKSVAGTIWDGILELIQGALDGLNAIIEGVLLIIEALWENKWEILKTVLETIWDAIKMLVNTALKAVRDIISFLMDSIGSIFSTVWDTVKDVFSTAWDTIKEIVGGGIEGVLSLLEGIATRFYEVGKAIVENIWNGIKEKWDELMDWFNDRLNDLAGLWPFSEPKDPRSPLRGLGKAGEAIVGNVLAGLELAMPRLDEALRGALMPAVAGADAAGGQATQTFGPTFQIEAHYRNLESESSLREDIQMLNLLYGGS